MNLALYIFNLWNNKAACKSDAAASKKKLEPVLLKLARQEYHQHPQKRWG